MTAADEIEALRDKLEAGERGDSDSDREALIEFSDRLFLLKQDYSDHRHVKLLRHCTRMSDHVGGLAAALDDREAAEAIVRWINKNYDNEETNRDYRVALRVFGRRVAPTDDDEAPPSIEWISAKTSRSYNPSPDRANMLTYRGDTIPMIEHAANKRDAALTAVQFEGGFRGYSELYEIRIGDISDTKHGVGIRVDGKTGERTVDMIIAVPQLQLWLGEHPAREDDDCYLWTRKDEPKRYSYQRFLQCLKETADRADVSKPVTPTNFRKSNAFWLAKQGKSQAFIEDRQGRKRGSRVIARYVAMFGEDDMQSQYAAMHGLEVDEAEREDNAPITCPRCDKKTPAHRAFCVWCDMALDYGAQEELESDARNLELAFLKLAQEHPKLIREASFRKQMLGHIDNPEIIERIETIANITADD